MILLLSLDLPRVKVSLLADAARPPLLLLLLWLLVFAACLQEAKRGLGASAVFIARNRFAVLDKASSTIQVR